MISVIITSWKEPNSIGKCILCIANKGYSGIVDNFEIIQISPDNETLDAGAKVAKELQLSNSQYIQIQDPHKGKPFALNLALKKAKGEILIFTDGDTYFGESAVKHLLKPFHDPKIWGVSGRPISVDSKEDIFGYWGHLLSDAANHKRLSINSSSFFPMSGYIMATRKFNFNIPSFILSDDAYISYSLRNLGKNISYSSDAICYVKYPKNLKDYYKQKVRSLGGFVQLKKLGIFKKEKQSRSFILELKYALFVLRYAQNPRELVWSLLLFPVRLFTWIKIFWERTLLNRGVGDSGWERVESTK